MTGGARGLAVLAERLKVPLGAEVLGRLDAFCTLLLTWNARINLTGAQSRDELESEHLPDAVALAALAAPKIRLVDVGSGGGLPAIPFAILRPDVDLTMVEPRAKRVAFLRTAVRAVGISASVRDCRVEDLRGDAFDLAASRATFSPEEWLPLGSGLAPNVVVFAARAVASPAELRLEEGLEYATGRGHPRWAGRFTRAPK